MGRHKGPRPITIAWKDVPRFRARAGRELDHFKRDGMAAFEYPGGRILVVVTGDFIAALWPSVESFRAKMADAERVHAEGLLSIPQTLGITSRFLESTAEMIRSIEEWLMGPFKASMDAVKRIDGVAAELGKHLLGGAGRP